MHESEWSRKFWPTYEELYDYFMPVMDSWAETKWHLEDRIYFQRIEINRLLEKIEELDRQNTNS